MKDTRTFEELVDDHLAYMIHELCIGTSWRSIVFRIMELTLDWRKSQDRGLEVKR